MKYCVYIHENIINGKVYIGITSQKPERRWDNGRGYSGNKHFKLAIEKYGWHNFNHRVLYDNLSKEQACEIEIALICAYNSANPKFGYNIELGGIGKKRTTKETKQKQSASHKGQQPWNKGVPHSEETRLKISEALTGGTLSKKTRERMSFSKMGNKNSFFGKHHTEDAIQRNKLNQPKRTTVMCVETGIIYESMAEASRKTGIRQGLISLACSGKREKAGAFHWKKQI